MVRISQARLQNFLATAHTATSTREQGQALENLVAYMFGKIPGVSITSKDTMNDFHTEEIDVAFWNEKETHGVHFLPHIILVECKNWNRPASSIEVNWFDTKLKHRGLSCGVLVALNGITGEPADLTAAHSIIAASLLEQRTIIVIKSEDINAITDTAQLVKLFKEKLCQLAVSGTAI